LHGDPADVDHDLRPRVEHRLLRPPVEPGTPMGAQVAEPVDVDAVLPAAAGDGGGPAGAGQPGVEVGPLLVRDADLEGPHPGTTPGFQSRTSTGWPSRSVAARTEYARRRPTDGPSPTGCSASNVDRSSSRSPS